MQNNSNRYRPELGDGDDNRFLQNLVIDIIVGIIGLSPIFYLFYKLTIS